MPILRFRFNVSRSSIACTIALMLLGGVVACEAPSSVQDTRSGQLATRFVGYADVENNTLAIQILSDDATEEEIASTRQALESVTVSSGGAHTPDTVELSTVSIEQVNFGCGTMDAFKGRVRLRSFFEGMRLENTVAEIHHISQIGREGCNSASPRAGVSDQYGLFEFGTIAAAGTPGDSVITEWKFKIPNQTYFWFQGSILADLVPESPTCYDGLMNGTESDIDCGGDTCAPCLDGLDCTDATDCSGGDCDTGTCGPLAGISLKDTTGLATTEAGGYASFDMRLDSQPTANVTIGFSSSDTTEGRVTTSAVVFTPDNWNAWRTVVIEGVDDGLMDGDAPYSIVTAAASSTDPAYDGLDAPDVSVTNQDDDSGICGNGVVELAEECDDGNLIGNDGCEANCSLTSGALEWAKRSGGAADDNGASVGTTADGSSIVAGSFTGAATFGAAEAFESELVSAGASDMYVAKYAGDGTLVWAKRAGGVGSDGGMGIAVAPDGSSTVTGYFFGTATFGQGEAGETALTSGGSRDIFVARYNADGTLAWARRAGGTSGDVGLDIAGDSDGASLVTGYFSGVSTFGAGEAGETVLSSAGGYDAFVARYEADGTLAWARGGSGAGDVLGRATAVAPDGSFAVVGYFAGAVTFGLGEPTETTLTAVGNDDAFIARFAANGSLLWARAAGGISDVWGCGVSIGLGGSIVVTGRFSGSVSFGPTTLTSIGGFDIFVAVFLADGTLDWAIRFGGPGFDSGESLITYPDGAFAITGYFSGTVSIGSHTITARGGFDIFVAIFNFDGSLRRIWWCGGSDDDQGADITITTGGSIVVVGSYRSNDALFGEGGQNETVLTRAGLNDSFIARFAGELVCRDAAVLDSDFGSFESSDWAVLRWGQWHVDGFLRLTPNENSRVGQIFNLVQRVDSSNVHLVFRFRAGSNNGGADGLAVSLVGAEDVEQLLDLLAVTGAGGGLGYQYSIAGAPAALHIEFDTWDNGSWEPSGDHVAVHRDGDHVAAVLGPASIANIEDGAWHDVTVSIQGRRVVVNLDGVVVLDGAIDALPFAEAYIGFSASTGAFRNAHDIDDLAIVQCGTAELCGNGEDDDGDLAVDCDDPDCFGDAACVSSCSAPANQAHFLVDAPTCLQRMRLAVYVKDVQPTLFLLSESYYAFTQSGSEAAQAFQKTIEAALRIADAVDTIGKVIEPDLGTSELVAEATLYPLNVLTDVFGYEIANIWIGALRAAIDADLGGDPTPVLTYAVEQALQTAANVWGFWDAIVQKQRFYNVRIAMDFLTEWYQYGGVEGGLGRMATVRGIPPSSVGTETIDALIDVLASEIGARRPLLGFDDYSVDDVRAVIFDAAADVDGMLPPM